MATVTLYQPTDMTQAEFGPVFSAPRTSIELDLVYGGAGSDGGPAVALLGAFSFDDFSGFVTHAVIDTGDQLLFPNIDISGLSFSFNSAFFVNILEPGHMLDMYSGMLAGDDLLTGSSGPDKILGFGGNDTFIADVGADFVDGGTGTNTVSYASAPAGVNVSLGDPGINTGYAAGDTYSFIQNLIGSAFNDALFGNDGPNALSAGAGNDLLVGYGGPDRFDGGAGMDTVAYDGSPFGLRADLLIPTTNTGDAAGDTYVSIENLEGSNANDTLLGDNNANVIRGNHNPSFTSGQDTIFGRGGNDTLLGLDGNDSLYGGDGSDHLTGGPGADKLTGGTSADTFIFNRTTDSTVASAGRDGLYDFSSAEGDKIDLHAIDASSTAAGNQDFTFIGTNAFSHIAGQLHYRVDGTTSYLEGDTNGDGAADFMIAVYHATSIAAGSIVL